MLEMKWTKVPPSKYGLYWVKYEDGADDIVEVRAGLHSNTFAVLSLGYSGFQYMPEFIEEYHQPSWYGPLEAPEEIK